MLWVLQYIAIEGLGGGGCGFSFPIVRPVEPALRVRSGCLESFHFICAEIFWLNNTKLAVAGLYSSGTLAFGMCAQTRVAVMVPQDMKEVRLLFSEDECALQLLFMAG